MNKIVNLDAVRKAREAIEAIECLEAAEPVATHVGGDEYLVQGCDGDHVYLWLASKPKGRKKFTVREIYPGMSEPETRLRDVDEEADLELKVTFADMDEVMDQLWAELFEGFDEDGDCTHEHEHCEA